VDLAVANAVQHHGMHPSVRLGHQVVRILLARRNGSVAKRADRVAAGWGGQGLQLRLDLVFLDAPRHRPDPLHHLGLNRPQGYSSGRAVCTLWTD
jgi:hypothetical protein